MATELKTRIICFAPSGVAEMIDMMALLYALRRHFESAHLAVACESPSALLAQSCGAVDEVIVLQTSWIPGLAAMKNAARIRKYDWAIAAKAEVDHRLAALVKLTKAKVRIGFETRTDKRSRYYTDPIALPQNPDEHRVDTLLRLLEPLGLVKATNWSADQMKLHLPESVHAVIEEALQERPFIMGTGYVVINLCTSGHLKFLEKDLLTLARNVLSATPFAIAFIAGPAQQKEAAEIGLVLSPERIGVVDPATPVELAALLEQAVFLVTLEDDAAHLAAAMGTPAVVIWSDGDFKRTHPRCRKHVFLHPESKDRGVPVERVWQGVLTLLTAKKYDIEKQWADLLQLPPSSDLTS